MSGGSAAGAGLEEGDVVEDSPRERAGAMLWDLSCSAEESANLSSNGVARICTLILNELKEEEVEDEGEGDQAPLPLSSSSSSGVYKTAVSRFSIWISVDLSAA